MTFYTGTHRRLLFHNLFRIYYRIWDTPLVRRTSNSKDLYIHDFRIGDIRRKSFSFSYTAHEESIIGNQTMSQSYKMQLPSTLLREKLRQQKKMA